MVHTSPAKTESYLRAKTRFLCAIRRSELRIHSRVFSFAIFIVLHTRLEC